GAGSQQIIAGIQQRGQAYLHRLTHARSDENILNAGNPLALRLAVNGFERFFDSGGRGISILATAHGLIDGFNHVRGRLEIKVERVANVERQNFVSLPCDLVGNAGQIADSVPDVFETGCGSNFAKLCDGHNPTQITAGTPSIILPKTSAHSASPR